MINEEIWQKICNFALDDPDVRAPLSARLGQMVGWTLEYTDKVVAEYRRFLYLTVTNQQPQVPSVDVDTVWHWHLQYTQNYWVELCMKTLGKAIHHIPSDGSDFGRQRFDYLYGQTLKNYEQVFGAPPPRDIWPTPEGGIETGNSMVDENFSFLEPAA